MSAQRRKRAGAPQGGLWRDEAAGYLRDRTGEGSVSLLAQLASKGTGPSFYKQGKSVFYLKDDLDAWALSRIKRFEPGNPPEGHAHANAEVA